VESPVTLVVLLITGPGLLVLGLWNLRVGAWREGIPAAELLILRAAGEEPSPRTAWDRRWSLINAGLSVLFGAFFSILALAVVYSLLSE
jgi:hypothetical protein